MEDNRFVRLNDILRQASEEHSILKCDGCRDWFQGDNESINTQVTEVTTLFNAALKSRYITQWSEPREIGLYWNWTVEAIAKARELDIALVSPLGDQPLFNTVCNRITTPIECILPTTLTDLAEEPFQHCEAVYERQVRFLISYEGKPVCALMPLVDLEMLKDIQTQVDPCKWLEWIQDLRERLGWPAVTFYDKEEWHPWTRSMTRHRFRDGLEGPDRTMCLPRAMIM